MPDLILELVTDHGNHYEVLDEAPQRGGSHHAVRRSATGDAVDLEYLFRSSRRPTYGYEATREAAMEAFARVWHRE
jgi:hypothetical protein